MNLTEMAKLLATVSLIDPRISRRDDNEKALMAQAWLVVIGDKIPFDFAAQCAQKHYQISGDVFMPVHIVSQWKLERDKESEKNKINEIRAINNDGGKKGMPDDVRAKLVEIGALKP